LEAHVRGSPFVLASVAIVLLGGACLNSSGLGDAGPHPAADDGGSSGSGSSSGMASSSSGSGSGGGSSGGPATGDSAAPSGAQFPFPQNRMSANCAYPTGVTPSQVTSAYAMWKTKFVVTDPAGNARVQDPNDTTNPNRTVSEGIGYGMILAVYMGDRALFDSLWAYEQEQAHLDSNGLMNWMITASDSIAGRGGATDADEDMAWALVMADRQWPGSGYLDQAKAQIQLVFSLEIDPSNNLVKWGDTSNTTTVHPDYFSPAYYRVFASVTGNTSGWNGATTAGYALVNASRNAATGLVPDLCAASGAATGKATDAMYGYDACRTPWRIGIDWCFNASTDAQGILTAMAGYFAGVGAANIKGPVALDGTAGSASFANPEFTGPAGIAAMVSSSDQTFLGQAWSRTYSQVQQSATSPNYFGASVGLISMLVMSGNFIDYTQ
jgi:endo-1,4-beta-D-glucanase Y